MNHSILAVRSIAAAVLMALTSVVAAEDETGMDGLPEYEPGKPWAEQFSGLPPFPSDENLVPLDTRFGEYQYFIDRKSVSVGKEDQIVRYTVVIDAPGGVRNVFYEGIRCDEKSYKTYAYGSGAGPFHPMASTDWKAIRSEAAFRYRQDLADFYVCDGPVVRFNPKEIVQRIENPPSVHDSTYLR